MNQTHPLVFSNTMAVEKSNKPGIKIKKVMITKKLEERD